MLLAEELALVAIRPGSGRHELGTGDQLNACLAGRLQEHLGMSTWDAAVASTAAIAGGVAATGSS